MPVPCSPRTPGGARIVAQPRPDRVGTQPLAQAPRQTRGQTASPEQPVDHPVCRQGDDDCAYPSATRPVATRLCKGPALGLRHHGVRAGRRGGAQAPGLGAPAQPHHRRRPLPHPAPPGWPRLGDQRVDTRHGPPRIEPQPPTAGRASLPAVDEVRRMRQATVHPPRATTRWVDRRGGTAGAGRPSSSGIAL